MSTYLNLDSNYIDRTDSKNKMDNLISIIEKVYSNRTYEINFQLIYSKCHELCQNRKAKELYQWIEILTDKIVNNYELTLSALNNKDEFYLHLIDIFSFYKSRSLAICDSLLYLERVRQRFTFTDTPLIDNCMSKFFKTLIENDNIRTKILNTFEIELKLVREEKNEKLNLFEKIIQFFTELKIYNKNFFTDEFIPILKKETDAFYSNYLMNFTSINSENTCKKILENFLVILNKEENLFKDLEEKDSILIITLDNLLIKSNDFIFSYGVKNYLLANDQNYMSLVYKLFSFKEFTKNKFYSSFQDLLSNLLKELEKNFIKKNNFNKIEYFNFFQYIEDLIEFKKKINLMLIKCMENNSKLEYIIKNCFEKIINKHEDFLENFVKLVHEEIKISIKVKNNKKVKEFTEKFLNIFKLFNDKDLFELEYRKSLAKRLLRIFL